MKIVDEERKRDWGDGYCHHAGCGQPRYYSQLNKGYMRACAAHVWLHIERELANVKGPSDAEE